MNFTILENELRTAAAKHVGPGEKFTCVNDGVATGGAGAHVVLGNHVDGVDLAAVQVVPGAVRAIGGAHVGVAVLALRHRHVGGGPIAFCPAHRAQGGLTPAEALQVLGYARS